jgi:hypothetical protein
MQIAELLQRKTVYISCVSFSKVEAGLQDWSLEIMTELYW